MKPHKRPGKAAKAIRKERASKRQVAFDTPYREHCKNRAMQLRQDLALYLIDNENGRWNGIICDLKIRIANLESV